MKILLLSDLNSIHTKKWALALAKKGCVLHFFGLTKPKDDFYDGLDNVTISYANIKNSSTVLNKIKYFSVVKQLKQQYHLFKPDIVHAHYATSYGLLGSFLKHQPFLISVWGSDVYEFPKQSFLHQFILKRNLKKATHLFSTSYNMAKETQLYTHKTINVVPFGVDLDQFKPIVNQQSNNAITIGIIKSLEDVYGITYLIDAFQIIKHKYPDAKLLIVGGGTKKTELQQKVKQLQLQNVSFLGKIKNDEVAHYYSKMDIVVIPSLQESFGVAAVEALACQKAVVASNVGGLPEIILDNKTGLLCPPKSAQCLANKIELFIKNPKLKQKLAINGKELVFKQYNWKNNVDLMYQHYQSIYQSFC